MSPSASVWIAHEMMVLLVVMVHLLFGDCFDVWNWEQVAPVVHEEAVADCVGPKPARLADDEPEGSGCFSWVVHDGSCVSGLVSEVRDLVVGGLIRDAVQGDDQWRVLAVYVALID